MNLKSTKVQKYWGCDPVKIDYTQMDQSIIRPFQGTHPKIVENWLPKDLGIFEVDPSYNLTQKQKNHRLKIKIEKLFSIDLSKKHFKLV